MSSRLTEHYLNSPYLSLFICKNEDMNNSYFTGLFEHQMRYYTKRPKKMPDIELILGKQTVIMSTSLPCIRHCLPALWEPYANNELFFLPAHQTPLSCWLLKDQQAFIECVLTKCQVFFTCYLNLTLTSPEVIGLSFFFSLR